VLTRGQGGVAAIVVTLVTCGLVVLDITDTGMRRWWAGHALTTDTVSGLLVLMITVLVVDQVVRYRQLSDRARAVGAQAVIVVGQAQRASRVITQAVSGSGDQDAASDEFRTYMMMLLVAAPVLIDAKVSRAFLEQAQSLGAEMARALALTGGKPDPADSARRLDRATKSLRTACSPLLQALDPQTLAAIDGGQDQAKAPSEDKMKPGGAR
jgi:hypothetical protein